MSTEKFLDVITSLSQTIQKLTSVVADIEKRIQRLEGLLLVFPEADVHVAEVAKERE